MVQHLQMWDYTSLSCSKDNRVIEFVDQQHEQFINPAVVENAHYVAPSVKQNNLILGKRFLKYLFHCRFLDIALN